MQMDYCVLYGKHRIYLPKQMDQLIALIQSMPHQGWDAYEKAYDEFIFLEGFKFKDRTVYVGEAFSKGRTLYQLQKDNSGAFVMHHPKGNLPVSNDFNYWGPSWPDYMSYRAYKKSSPPPRGAVVDLCQQRVFEQPHILHAYQWMLRGGVEVLPYSQMMDHELNRELKHMDVISLDGEYGVVLTNPKKGQRGIYLLDSKKWLTHTSVHLHHAKDIRYVDSFYHLEESMKKRIRYALELR